MSAWICAFNRLHSICQWNGKYCPFGRHFSLSHLFVSAYLLIYDKTRAKLNVVACACTNSQYCITASLSLLVTHKIKIAKNFHSLFMQYNWMQCVRSAHTHSTQHTFIDIFRALSVFISWDEFCINYISISISILRHNSKRIFNLNPLHIITNYTLQFRAIVNIHI